MELKKAPNYADSASAHASDPINDKPMSKRLQPSTKDRVITMHQIMAQFLWLQKVAHFLGLRAMNYADGNPIWTKPSGKQRHEATLGQASC